MKNNSEGDVTFPEYFHEPDPEANRSPGLNDTLLFSEQNKQCTARLHFGRARALRTASGLTICLITIVNWLAQKERVSTYNFVIMTVCRQQKYTS